MKYIILLLLASLTSCITIKRSRSEDGYSKADKTQISAYEPEINSAEEPDSFRLVEINASQLKDAISQSDNALVVMWTTWCGRCILDMPYLVSEAKTKDIFFVCPDYDLKGISKVFSKYDYNKPVYIISSSEYGTGSAIKTRLFQHELLSNNSDSTVSFPRHFHFRKGEFAGKVNGHLEPGKLDALFAKESEVLKNE